MSHLAIASALIEPAESLALDGRHSIPVLAPVAQINPRFAAANVARQQVPPETETERKQDDGVRD